MNENRTAWRMFALAVVATTAGVLPFACSDSHIDTGDVATGTRAASGTGSAGQGGGPPTGSTSAGPAQTGAGGVSPPTSVAPCQGHIYECGDLVDNDGDGLVDSEDPDCLGPCDNTEGSLFGGIPGQSGPPCKLDCYFDQDSGPGNDDCYWTHECDPLEAPPGYHPESSNGAQCAYAGPNHVVPPTGKTCTELQASQSAQCHAFCGPLTPNGCDCFGCCELPAESGSFVWLGSTGPSGNTQCTLDKLGDPTVCEPCTPVADCLNPCDPCEICAGKPAPDPGCNQSSSSSGTGGGTQCAPGVIACGAPGQAACSSNTFCLTGCCVEVPQ